MRPSGKLAGALFVLALAGFAPACTSTTESDPAPTPKPLEAGAGEALIDLPVGHSTAGYAQTSVLAFAFPEDEPGSPFADLFPASRGLQAPPKAKAVLLDDGVTLMALARIDAIGVSDVLLDRTVTLAKEDLGLDLRDRLILSATHTHAAGARFATSLRIKLLENEEGWRQDAVGHGLDSFNPESVDRVARSIVKALGQAKAALRPAALGYARGERDDANRDRRCNDDDEYGEDNIDIGVRLVRIDAVDAESGEPEAPIAVLVNYAMHGTILGAYNHHLSTDGPGFVETKLEERFGAPVTVMYMQGTAGDVSPGGHGQGSQRMEDVGYRVAEEAHRLYRAVTGAAEAEGVRELSRDIPLGIKTRRIPLSRELLGYEEGEFFEDGAILCQFTAEACETKTTPLSVSCLGHGLEGQGKYHTDIAVADIGGLKIFAVPGEAVSEIGRVLREGADPEDEVMIYAYAQDHNGYILMPDDWMSGGYEPTISYWGWRFAPYLIEQHLDLYEELRTGKAAKKHPTPKIELPAIEYEPVPAAASAGAPAVTLEPAAAYTRLQAVQIAWNGGDPVLGHPSVSIETAAGEPLRTRGWRPVSNAHVDIVTDYRAEPTFEEAPTAGKRRHGWSAVWEIPAWVSVGSYRVRITGTTLPAAGAQPESYDLVSAPFEIQVADGLTVGANCALATGDYFHVVSTATGLEIELSAFYPQAAPVWDEVFNEGDHQLGNYRLFSERGTTDFPIVDGMAGTVRVIYNNAVTETVSLTWVSEGTDKVPTLCPGEEGLPRLEGSMAWKGAGTYRIEFDTGDVTDAYGNRLQGTFRSLAH